jgi:hypothetical protein
MRRASPALTVERLTVRYGATLAVDAADLEVGRGEVVAVVGPSGCGKSSLLRAVAGLVPSTGHLRADDRALDALPPHRRGVGVVFQDHALFPHLDVAGNVAFGLVEARAPAELRRERVREWLAAWASRTVPATTSSACRAASGSGWRWHGPWRRGHRSWCSTNPSPPSTRGCAGASRGRSPAGCATWAPPRCSSPTTWTRRWRSATASRCCGRGGWCRWRRRPN